MLRLALTLGCYLALVAAFLAPAALTVSAARLYIRARRLLALAERDRARASLVLTAAVRMLPRSRRPRAPDAAR